MTDTKSNKQVLAMNYRFKVPFRILSFSSQYRFFSCWSIPYPVLGPHMDQLKDILQKEAQLPAHKRQTSKKIYGLLQNEGYEGGYDAVRRYISNWKKQQGTGMKNAYIPQQFEKGEAFQFDWNHDVAAHAKCPTPPL